MEITLHPIAWVSNNRIEPVDDFWEEIISEIVLDESMPTEALNNIEQFSHLEVVFYFHQVDESAIVFSGRPRGNENYPIMGIFGQRKKDRPNRIGLCTVELVSHNGRSITVKYLDAINDTPILDIKPVFKEFTPKSEVKQPDWASDLMKDYW